MLKDANLMDCLANAKLDSPSSELCTSKMTVRNKLNLTNGMARMANRRNIITFFAKRTGTHIF